MVQPPFGVILAGGRNVRYGDLKALATVGGRPIIERALEALRSVTPDVVLIASDDAYLRLGLPMRADLVPGQGPLRGVQAGLHWAAEEKRPGIIAAACDMPFISSELLRRLLQEVAAPETPDLVVPESEGPRALEPLCAYYSVSCLPAIERALARADLSMVGFHDEIKVARVALLEVRLFGEPNTLFLNVNSPESRVHAEHIARLLDA